MWQTSYEKDPQADEERRIRMEAAGVNIQNCGDLQLFAFEQTFFNTPKKVSELVWNEQAHGIINTAKTSAYGS
jgi:hypothetical protein